MSELFLAYLLPAAISLQAVITTTEPGGSSSEFKTFLVSPN